MKKEVVDIKDIDCFYYRKSKFWVRVNKGLTHVRLMRGISYDDKCNPENITKTNAKSEIMTKYDWSHLKAFVQEYSFLKVNNLEYELQCEENNKRMSIRLNVI